MPTYSIDIFPRNPVKTILSEAMAIALKNKFWTPSPHLTDNPVNQVRQATARPFRDPVLPLGIDPDNVNENIPRTRAVAHLIREGHPAKQHERF